MMEQIENLHRIQAEIAGRAQLIAVSKTYAVEAIQPLLQAGHLAFGENRVQEAQTKWPSLKSQYPKIELHLIGPLQSNKAADAVSLFDVIQTIDRPKIAKALAHEMVRQNRKLPCYIQVNIGREPQKAGIEIEQVSMFHNECRHGLGLNIIGLMCIPPAQQDPRPYFKKLQQLAKLENLEALSMGMSGDYALAIEEGATCVRVGSAIFGNRAQIIK